MNIRNLISFLFRPLIKIRLRKIDQKFKIKNKKEVAIVLLEKMGDIILSTPIIHNYKKLGYKICFICSKDYEWVVEDNPEIDEYILIPTYSTKNFIKRLLNRQIWFLLKDKIENYSHFEKKIFLSVYPDFTINQCKSHIINFYVKKAKIKISQKKPIIIFNKQNSDFIRRFFIKNKIKEKKYIVIGYSSSAEEKIWPLKNFRIIAKKLRKEYPNIKIIFVGGKNDQKIVSKDKYIIQIRGEKLWNIARLIKGSKLFIGLDSGLTHLASAFDVPIVAIYPNKKSVTLTGPLAKNKIVIFSNKNNIKCISVLDVYLCINRILKNNATLYNLRVAA